MKVLSNASIYGLRALIYVASQKNEKEYVSIREMSESMDISFHFLTKILQTLTKNGILYSSRGPHGGVALTRPPGQVFMVEIVKILEGEDYFDTCFLGHPDCGIAAPCPMHDFWINVKSVFLDRFEKTSLEELSAKIKEGKLRL
ncbi:MAG TPA: Rrf2 family transcriptional regulator [Bacteroidetes bacterium]|nr:Rrf2 family transcriptional regulator [Bacteroidota bacterium]